MKAARLEAPGKASVVDVDKPQIGPDDVLIEVKAAGICGTDVHIYKGEYEATYPLVPGHEFSGVVAAVGDNVTRFAVGQRVTADPNVPCNRCPACQRNEPNQCHNLGAIGVTTNGAFAEYVKAPEGNVFSIGDMPFSEAALIEPLACVVWGLKRVQIQPGDSVLVLGVGPMGALLIQSVARAGAAQIVATDVVQQRLDLAMQLGATETVLAGDRQAQQLRALAPLGYDVVVDATGIPAVLASAFDYVRPRGKVWVFGVTPIDARISVSPYDIFRKDLTVIGSFAVNRTFSEAIALIQHGAVDVAPLVSHRLPLDDFSRGIDLAQHDPDRIKVQFEI